MAPLPSRPNCRGKGSPSRCAWNRTRKTVEGGRRPSSPSSAARDLIHGAAHSPSPNRPPRRSCETMSRPTDQEYGYLALVLHAHLPFVRHPENRHHLEELWLFEAITDTYFPLLDLMEGWVR